MMQFDARFCEQNRMIVLEESAGQLVIGTVQESDRRRGTGSTALYRT